MSPIVFERLGFAYRPGAWVIRDLTGEVAPGTVLAVLGPNGRGKSTFLKLLLGSLRPQEGSVRLAGRAALVPQLFTSPFDYSVLDMVLMGRARQIGLLAQPGRADFAAAEAALDRLGIADLAPRGFGSLSGGQRQLVILARALVSDADLLLLDEPTSALDFRNQSVVLQWMRRLAHDHGWTLAFTTHDPHHALVAADGALLLHAPNRAELVPTAKLTGDRLTELYNHPMARIGRDGSAVPGTGPDIIAPIFTPEADA